MPSITALIAAAYSLASEQGENPEYDRALVELIGEFLPGEREHRHGYLEPLILHDSDDSRTRQGKHRTWQILPRVGTGPDDRWTVIGSPIPAPGNPCSSTEDGQFATLGQAWLALAECERLDDGTDLAD